MLRDSQQSGENDVASNRVSGANDDGNDADNDGDSDSDSCGVIY